MITIFNISINFFPQRIGKINIRMLEAIMSTPDTSDTSTIAGSIISVLVVILLVVLGIIFWKKKKLFGMQYTITIFTTYISMMQIHEK